MAVYRGSTDERGEKVIEYVGCTISTRERNGYDDSDFEALVEQEDGTFRWIDYATTRFYTYDHYATVDATPEVMARYEAHEKARKARQAAHHADVQAHMPEKGKLAILRKATKSKGERYEAGLVGTIIWFGTDTFKRKWVDDSLRKAYGITSIDLDCRDPYKRVGLKLEDGRTLFTAASMVDVIVEPIEA